MPTPPIPPIEAIHRYLERFTMWENVIYQVETLDDPRITKFVDEMTKIYVNGGVILRSFKAVDEAEFRASHNVNYSLDRMLEILLNNNTVKQSLFDSEAGCSLRLERSPKFRWDNVFSIEGQLTYSLLTGGAYERFSGTIDEARRLSRDMVEAIFGEELHRVSSAAFSCVPWSSWFCDVAWDSTFLIQDWRTHRIILLCMTDTD